MPPGLLERSRLTAADLTYLELGNYLTDVSQFRDPVSYLFAKQRVWREKIIPKAADSTKVQLLRGLGALSSLAVLGATQKLKDLTSGTAADLTSYGGAAAAGVLAILASLPTDVLAALGGADDWIDEMLGTPLERTPGDPKAREEKHYGKVGMFFRHFIEGVTHLLFAQDVRERVKGGWGSITPIPAERVTEVFGTSFTQYYPHEHTDQPPYVWDAGKRPQYPSLYGPSRRQRTLKDPDIGVMNAVDTHYVQYLAEGLEDVEQAWRALKPADTSGRQELLVRMGKLLHGIEDWFFHSNVVELLRLRAHTPPQGAAESDEDFLRRFVTQLSATDPEFAADQRRLRRKLYRRLRFPAYERGTKTESAGRLSRQTMSAPSLRHAYPAFPSQQDTSHTLMHALENLEHKLRLATDRLTRPAAGSLPRGGGLPGYVLCVARKLFEARDGTGRALLEQKAAERGVGITEVLAAVAGSGPQRARAELVIVDVLREWVPLFLTLLDESERMRLAAGIAPRSWPPEPGSDPPPRAKDAKTELDLQLERHEAALEPRTTDDERVENNYERAIRYLTDCGFLNSRGRDALTTAFKIDAETQKKLPGAPGAGGFLLQFAIELQEALDAGEAAAQRLDQDERRVFDQRSDNGAFNEIVGSHSLMSKDTLTSIPFFDDTRVLASVASSAVLIIMLQQVGAPAHGLDWTRILHHFIRYPPAGIGWERQAIALFHQNNRQIPKFADLPELAGLTRSATRPAAPRERRKRQELEEHYIRLEAELAGYRHP
ncbi:hypothetical protein [Nonomuraea sp. NPDC050540]|uniref:hypothetical protein n=1 Tax=Nonomuraea sp. NPDC050540 TaxID=3364367 RepID=UPI0037A43510